MVTNIKIKGLDAEDLEKKIEDAMNLVALFVRGGRLPQGDDTTNPQRGMWWQYNIEESKYEFFHTNDYKAFVREKEENFIVLEFHYRYGHRDEINFNTIMSQTIFLMLGNEFVEILNV